MQNLLCYRCGTSNDLESYRCKSCNSILFNPKKELKLIAEDVNDFNKTIKSKYQELNKRVADFDEKLTLLELRASESIQPDAKETIEQIVPEIEKQKEEIKEELSHTDTEYTSQFDYEASETKEAEIDKGEVSSETVEKEQTITPEKKVASQYIFQPPVKKNDDVKTDAEQVENNTEEIKEAPEEKEKYVATTASVQHSEVFEQKEEPKELSFYEQRQQQREKEKIQQQKTTEKPKQYVAEKVKPAPIKPKEPQPSLVDKLKKNEVFMTFVEETLSPLFKVTDFVKDYYKKSKEKNQLPVFFMTLAGVVALLFGFGYLMQLSLSSLGEHSQLVKTLIGFAFSGGILYWGIRSEKKGEKYRNFASALLGQSIALNYLFIYFISDIPWLSSPLVGFLMILANTVLAKFLALRYETKIVAVISLAGGAFAPFYLSTDSSSPLYFFYLWILTAGGIYISKRLKWPALAFISFIISSIVIESSVFAFELGWTLFIDSILFHAFAYLFVVYALVQKRKIIETVDRTRATLLAGSIALLLVNLVQLYNTAGQVELLGYILLANATLFIIALGVLFKRLTPKIKVLFFIIAGSFAAFAVPALFDAEYMGVAWLAEALVLSYLGFSFNLPSVRKEALVLWGVAFFKIVHTISGLYIFKASLITKPIDAISPHVTSEIALFNYSMVNLLALFTGLTLFWVFATRFSEGLKKFEKNVIALFQNFTVVLGCSIIALIAFFKPSEFSTLISAVAAFPVLYIAHKTKLKFSIAFSHIWFWSFITLTLLGTITIFKLVWGGSVFNWGIGGIVALIALIFAMRNWCRFVVYKSSYNSKIRKGAVYSYSEISSFVFILGGSFILYFIHPYFSILYFLPLYLVSERLTFKYHLEASRLIHNLLFIVVTVYALIGGAYNVTIEEPLLWKICFASVPVYWLLRLISINQFFKKKPKSVASATYLIESVFAISLFLCFYAILFFEVREYFMISAPVTIVAYLFYYKKRKLEAIQISAYLQFILLVVALILTGVNNEGFRFSRLPLHGKIYFIEIAVLLWAFKQIYDSFKIKSNGKNYASFMREVFYGIIPFSFLSPVNRLFPEYLAIAFWGSALVAFGMNYFLKRKHLLIELYVAAGIASVLGVVESMNNLTVWAGVVSVAIMLLVDIKRKHGNISFTQIKPLSFVWVYYFCFAIGLFFYRITGNIVYMLSISSILFMAVSIIIDRFRQSNVYIKSSFKYISYSLTAAVIGYSLNGVLQAVEILLTSIIIIMQMADVYFLRKKTVINKPLFVFSLDTILVHIFIMGIYAELSNKVVFSTLIIIHAVILLFNSIPVRFKRLIWLSISFFAIAVIKLVAYDLKNLSMGEKLFVLIGSGVILLGASFLYVKLKDKFITENVALAEVKDEKQHSNLEDKEESVSDDIE